MTPEDLKNAVGTELGVSDWTKITQPMIDAFADVTDDHQFIHVDPEKAAQETPFGGTIAHGFLTLSLLAGMGYQVIPDIEGAQMGVNYGLNRVRFIAPVPAGARVRGRFTLAECREDKPGELTTTWEVTVEIEGADKPALIAQWINRRYIAPAA
jgi:acyl dehydratase